MEHRSPKLKINAKLLGHTYSTDGEDELTFPLNLSTTTSADIFKDLYNMSNNSIDTIKTSDIFKYSSGSNCDYGELSSIRTPSFNTFLTTSSKGTCLQEFSIKSTNSLERKDSYKTADFGESVSKLSYSNAASSTTLNTSDLFIQINANTSTVKCDAENASKKYDTSAVSFIKTSDLFKTPKSDKLTADNNHDDGSTTTSVTDLFANSSEETLVPAYSNESVSTVAAVIKNSFMSKHNLSPLNSYYALKSKLSNITYEHTSCDLLSRDVAGATTTPVESAQYLQQKSQVINSNQSDVASSHSNNIDMFTYPSYTTVPSFHSSIGFRPRSFSDGDIVSAVFLKRLNEITTELNELSKLGCNRGVGDAPLNLNSLFDKILADINSLSMHLNGSAMLLESTTLEIFQAQIRQLLEKGEKIRNQIFSKYKQNVTTFVGKPTNSVNIQNCSSENSSYASCDSASSDNSNAKHKHGRTLEKSVITTNSNKTKETHKSLFDKSQQQFAEEFRQNRYHSEYTSQNNSASTIFVENRKEQHLRHSSEKYSDNILTEENKSKYNDFRNSSGNQSPSTLTAESRKPQHFSYSPENQSDTSFTAENKRMYHRLKHSSGNYSPSAHIEENRKQHLRHLSRIRSDSTFTVLRKNIEQGIKHEHLRDLSENYSDSTFAEELKTKHVASNHISRNHSPVCFEESRKHQHSKHITENLSSSTCSDQYKKLRHRKQLSENNSSATSSMESSGRYTASHRPSSSSLSSSYNNVSTQASVKKPKQATAAAANRTKTKSPYIIQKKTKAGEDEDYPHNLLRTFLKEPSDMVANDWLQNINNNKFKAKNRSNAHIFLCNDEISGYELSFINLNNCLVEIHGFTKSIYIKNARDCLFLCGPAMNDVIIENCHETVFMLACNDLHIISSTLLCLMLLVTHRTIMSKSTGLLIGAYCYDYTDIEQDFVQSKLNKSKSNIVRIKDLDTKKGETSTNWDLMQTIDLPDWQTMRTDMLQKILKSGKCPV